MSCSHCVTILQPRGKHNYLVQLVDDETGKWGRCIVQSECPHEMQEWMDHLAEQAQLWVHDQNDEQFLMLHPRVLDIDDRVASHLPIADPCDS